MPDDVRLPQALPPEQLQQIAQVVLEGMRGDIKALLKATAQAPALPPPNRPPIEFDGLDARQMERLKKELLLETKDFVRVQVEDFLPDVEIEQRIKRGSESVSRQIEKLHDDLLKEVRSVVREEVNGLRTEIFKIFDDLDMPLDEGKPRKETREKLSMLWAMQRTSSEWKTELFKAIRAVSITGLVGLIGGFFTYLFTRGGPPH